MKCCVTLSANAGVSIQSCGKKILADPFPRQTVRSFSAISEDIYEKMLIHPAFCHPDLIFFTHDHPDHYSREMTNEWVTRYPGVKLLLPPERTGFDPPEANPVICGDISLRTISLPHGGEEYAAVPHRGCIINAPDGCMLLSGDCTKPCEALERIASINRIDIAILNFSWITLRTNREFLRSVLRPSHIVINHIPFAEDDVYHYRRAAELSLRYFEEYDIRLLTEPLQSEIFS